MDIKTTGDKERSDPNFYQEGKCDTCTMHQDTGLAPQKWEEKSKSDS